MSRGLGDVYKRQQLADAELIQAINPLSYLTTTSSQVAKHWRIRHGAADRDTSFAIPIILAIMLENHGYGIDFALPWDIPHSGDYDLGDLFSWIDGLCQWFEYDEWKRPARASCLAGLFV